MINSSNEEDGEDDNGSTGNIVVVLMDVDDCIVVDLHNRNNLVDRPKREWNQARKANDKV